MPVYDKPMIYYPLATLMSAGIREYLIITTPRDQDRLPRSAGHGAQWGLSFEYVVQAQPNGIAQALIIGERFSDGAPSALILGDNIFYGANLTELLKSASDRANGATVFGYYVQDPERYGVVQFDAEGRVTDLLEKPARRRRIMRSPAFISTTAAPRRSRSRLAPSALAASSRSPT